MLKYSMGFIVKSTSRQSLSQREKKWRRAAWVWVPHALGGNGCHYIADMQQVCVYVCMYACMYVCMYVMYVCMCVMYVCMCVMYVCMCVCM